MGRRKLSPTIKPNILKSMLEYTLISSILDRIYEMKKKKTPLGYLRDDTKVDPFQHLVEIRTRGTKWKRVIDKIDEWAT
jgi:hypothetical protein